MKEKSIESLLAELKSQRNACIGMDLEGDPETEQRLAIAKAGILGERASIHSRQACY